MKDTMVSVIKSDLKNYNDYKKIVKGLNDRKKELLDELVSIKANSYETTPLGNAADIPHRDTCKNQRIFDIEDKISLYNDRITLCDVIMDGCEPTIYKLIKDIYINGSSYSVVAENNGFSVGKLQKIIDEEIKRITTK